MDMESKDLKLESITSYSDFADLKIVDVDTHFSEPHDLWTSRVSGDMKNKVPRVVHKEDDSYWVVGEKETVLHRASPASVVGKDYAKIYGGDFLATNIDQVHESSYNLESRVEIMDALGIHTQILYPNVGGIGFTLLVEDDDDVRMETVRTYNDVTLQAQNDTNDRILPMTVTPFWDIKAAVKEVERCVDLGSHGIVIGGDVHTSGVPDLGQDYWNPLWEICEDKRLPVNFHIGGSEMAKMIYENAAWPKFDAEAHLAITSCSLFVDNARVIGNLIYAGVPERHPKLQFVSVESGLGWIPFYLEALDYQLIETGTDLRGNMSMKPSEYFKQNFYASFWFESGLGAGLESSVAALGADRIMFETDYPHPTCLYPGPLDFLKKSVSKLSKKAQKQILQDNAAKLYNVDLSK